MIMTSIEVPPTTTRWSTIGTDTGNHTLDF